MTPSLRSSRALTALAALAILAITAGSPVRAEALGDIYVATASGSEDLGVLELDTFHSSVRTGSIDPTEAVRRLEFNGKQTLYAANGGTGLYAIDVEQGTVSALDPLTAVVKDLAHPIGTTLYLAVPSKKAIWALAAGDTRPDGTIAVSGAVDLLAASPDRPGMLAANTGDAFVDLVLSDTRVVRPIAGLSGTVVALAVSGKPDTVSPAAASPAAASPAAPAVDRALGYIALKNPNKVVAVSMETGTIAWTATLKAEPTAITASWDAKLPAAAVVAVGTQLFSVTDGVAKPWRSLSASSEPVTLMTTSYRGDRLHLVTGSSIVSIDVANPLVQALPTITLRSAPQDLAPFPDSSTANGGGGPHSGDGNGSGNGSGSASPAPTRAPSTDTVGGLGDWLPAGTDPLTVFGIFMGVTIALTVTGLWVARRWIVD